MKKALCRTIAAAVAVASCAANALAQTEARPPSAAVFGAASDRTTARQTLDATVSVVEAYDQDVQLRSGTSALSMFPGSGFYTTLTPLLDFESRGSRMQVGITAGSSARYYGDLGMTVLTNLSAGVGFSGQLTPRTSVSFNQNVMYAPALSNGLFAAGAAPGAVDSASAASNYALNTERSPSYSTTGGFSYKITERAAVSVNSSFRYTDFTGHNPGFLDVRSQDVGGRFNYSLSRYVKLRLGYSLKQGQYQGSPRSSENNVDIGIDYSRPLSRTRRTTLSFALGPTVANGTLIAGGLQDLRRQYRLTADVALKHQMGQTWSVQSTYHRGMGYIGGFQSPVFTAAYEAMAGGFLNRRTDVNFSAAYSTGESALTGAGSQFITYTGDARMRVALGRMWATYVEYLFYYYKFDQSMPQPVGVPPGLTRNGLRIGLTMWIPVRHR